MTRRPMATPRGDQWHVGPRRRWRGWAQALLLLGVLLVAGIEDVQF